MSADAEPRTPRRWPGRLALLALLTLVGLGLLVAFAPQLVAHTPLRDRVLAAATKDLKGTLSVTGLSLSWFDAVEVTGVTLAGEDGRTAVTIPKLTTSKTLLALARDPADLGTVTVDGATVSLYCEPGTTNLETILANYLTPDPAKPASVRPAIALEVVGATVELSEAGSAVVQKLDAVGATVTVPAVSGPITMRVEVAGKLRATASLDGDAATAHAEATAFALETVGPLARRFSPGADVSGALTATADVTRAGPDLDVKGSAEAKDLSVAGPWLADRVVLKSLVVKPTEVAYKGGELRVAGFDMACDAGTVTAAGTVSLSGDPEDALNQAGLKLHADLDLARLAAIAPKVLRLQPGTEVREGKVSLRLDSAASATHPGSAEWVGSLTTTALRGTRAGKELAWEKPLNTQFTARFDKKLRPTFDKLQCEAEFIGLAGRGSADSFIVMANVDLTRLAARLGDFIDLGGNRFGGYAEVSLKNEPRAGGGFTTTGTATLKNGQFTDAAGRGLTEPLLTITLAAAGAIDPAGPVRIDAADFAVVAGADRFAAKLLDPVADARKARGGRLDVRLAGELARWRSRVAPWADLPADWQVAGVADAAGVVAATDAGVTLTAARADVTNARFLGMGLDVTEPKLKLEAGATWTRATGEIGLTNVVAHCETVVLTTPRVDVRPSGTVAMTAKVTANVNRVQRALKLQSDPAGSDAVNGLAIGTLDLTADGPGIGFAADFKIDGFTLGAPGKPVWREPWVKVRAKGRYGDDRVALDAATAERDGLTAEARGALDRLATTMDLNLTGTVTYDLAKLEPQLKEYLGAGGRVTGTGAKPFELAGPLNGPTGAMVALAGTAGVAWQEVKAYGLEVGPGELRARLDRGVVTTNPVEASFGGGKVRVEPTVTLTPTMTLSVAPGRIVEKAKLTPAALANAVGYALPAFAGSTQADGLFSFDVTDSRVPLGDPERGTVRGSLTVHTATVSPGPIIAEIATLLGAKQTTLTQTKEQVVPIKLENGRVHHEKFTIVLGQSEIHSTGSVGLDKSLAIVLDMPIPPKLLDQYLGNNPRLREALGKQRVAVPVGGTMARPAIDAAKLNASVAGLVRNAGKDAATGAATDAVKKIEGQLRDELFKKFGKPPQ